MTNETCRKFFWRLSREALFLWEGPGGKEQGRRVGRVRVEKNIPSSNARLVVSPCDYWLCFRRKPAKKRKLLEES